MKSVENIPHKNGSLLHQQIKKVALERFSRFGIERTTMYEIANILDISSNVLATHFTDKQELISEIGKDLIMEENLQLAKHIRQNISTLQMLFTYLEIKIDNRKKYNYTKGVKQFKNLYRSLPTSLINLLKTIERKQVQSILKRGVKRGEIVALPVKPIAEVYAEMVFGVVFDTYDDILAKQKEMTKTFLNGLIPSAEHQRSMAAASLIPSF